MAFSAISLPWSTEEAVLEDHLQRLEGVLSRAERDQRVDR